MTNNNLLAERLRYQFSNRGVRASFAGTAPNNSGFNNRPAEAVTINRRYHAPDPSHPPMSRRPSGTAGTGRTNSSFAEKKEKTKSAPEVKVRKKHLSPLLPVLLIIATIMIVTAVASISEAYQKTTEVARLENQLETLTNEASELKLKLEEKNDIRVIGSLATTKLGMTKEDSLQRRYVSLSDGERIELIQTEEKEARTGGVLLSAFADYLDRIADRFR